MSSTCSTYPNKRRVPRLWLSLVLIGSCLPLASSAAQLTEGEAIDLLMHRIAVDHLYRGTNRGCIAFQGEGTGATYVHIVVREDHHPRCGGDPRVEPVIDRFVVDFRTDEIFAVNIFARPENDLVAYRRFKILRNLGQLPSDSDAVDGRRSDDGLLKLAQPVPSYGSKSLVDAAATTLSNQSIDERGMPDHPLVVRSADPTVTYWGHAAEFWTGWLTFGLVVVGALTGLVLFWQARLLRAQVKESKEATSATKIAADAALQGSIAAKLSAESSVRIQLPVLVAKPGELLGLHEPIPDNGAYAAHNVDLIPSRYSGIDAIQVLNVGRSEAFLREVRAGWSVCTRLPDEPNYTWSLLLSHSHVLRPGNDDNERVEVGITIELSEAEIAEITTDRQWLWFYGEIDYIDFMGDERHYRFCWRFARRNVEDGLRYFASDGSPPTAYLKRYES